MALVFDCNCLFWVSLRVSCSDLRQGSCWLSCLRGCSSVLLHARRFGRFAVILLGFEPGCLRWFGQISFEIMMVIKIAFSGLFFPGWCQRPSSSTSMSPSSIPQLNFLYSDSYHQLVIAESSFHWFTPEDALYQPPIEWYLVSQGFMDWM